MGNIALDRETQHLISLAMWAGVIFMVLLFIGSFTWFSPQSITIPEPERVDYDLIKIIVDNSVGDCSLNAEEIAGLMPKIESADNKLLNEFLEKQFGDEYTELEEASYIAVIAELEEDDYEVLSDYLKDNIENFDELESVNEDDDETVISVIEIGLDEDEDKEAKVYLEMKIKYTLLSGVATKYKETVIVQGNVVFDEGDLEDDKVNLILSY